MTGLIVQDTAAYWSFFGQLILLLLIQIGGMGVVTLAVMFLIVTGGIGFITWEDIRKKKHHIKKYRMQSKVILVTTMLLIVVPAVYFFCLSCPGIR